MNTPAQPAAPLDSPPILYRGLNAVEIVQLLCAAAGLWLLPSIFVGAYLFDGFQALNASVIMLTLSTVLTMFMTATLIRQLRRGKPYNWINRQLVARLPWTNSTLVKHRAGWNL